MKIIKGNQGKINSKQLDFFFFSKVKSDVIILDGGIFFVQRNAQSVCVLHKYLFPNLNILNLWLFTSFSKQRVAAIVIFTGATNRQCVCDRMYGISSKAFVSSCLFECFMLIFRQQANNLRTVVPVRLQKKTGPNSLNMTVIILVMLSHKFPIQLPQIKFRYLTLHLSGRDARFKASC